MVEHVVEPEGDIDRRLVKTLAEIGERVFIGKRVVLEQSGDAVLVDARREQFGQRSGNRIEHRHVAHKTHIGIAGKPRARQNAAVGRNVIRIEPNRLGKLQPAPDTAALFPAAVVILDPLAPGPPDRDVLAARHESGILQRNAALVVEPVDHPSAHLRHRASATMQHAVKRMLVVIARSTDGAQPGFKIGSVQGNILCFRQVRSPCRHGRLRSRLR